MPRSNSFLDLGPSYLRYHVAYAWQDPSPIERGAVKRNSTWEEAQRRYVPGVAGNRLRGQNGGPGRILNSVVKGALGPGDGQGHLDSSLQSGNQDGSVPRFVEALYGRSLRVQSAAPTTVASVSGGSNGIFRGANKSTLEPQTFQRPHTACTPAVERHLRRYTRCMSAGNAGQHRSPDVFSSAERPAGRFGSLSAAGELAARPTTPGSGVMSQGGMAAYGRHVGGAALDRSDRRPGRSKSTEPALLGKSSSGRDMTNNAADNLTGAVKSGTRPKLKAAVDCWWDEQHLGGGRHHRSTSSSGTSGGAKRSSVQRSLSAGNRKFSASDSKSSHAGDRVNGSSSRSTRSKSWSLTSQGRKSLSKSIGCSSTDDRQDTSSTSANLEGSGSLAGGLGRSSVSQPGVSNSTANSLTLISKLALPDTAASYMSQGKHSLSSALDGSSDDQDSKVDLPHEHARTRVEAATPSLLKDLPAPSTNCSTDELKESHEQPQGLNPPQVLERKLGDRSPGAAAKTPDAEASNTPSHEIRALQDISHKISREFGITGAWFDDFCEQLIDEWESDVEDEDVNDE